jgi:hypothetical protein
MNCGIQTITVDPMLRNQLRLASLVSTVDALNGIASRRKRTHQNIVG